MVNEYLEKLHMLPAHMRDGMQRWIELGRDSHPGDFLSAVLSNDLAEAFSRADDINQAAMREYVVYLYSYAPRGCWGSKENFTAWRGILAKQEAA